MKNNYNKKQILIEGSTKIEEITTDRKVVIRLLIDSSSSMQNYKKEMVSGLNLLKNSIINSKESGDILIGKTLFDNKSTVDAYTGITDFSVKYNPYGGTALYDAIIEAQEGLMNEDEDGYIDVLKAHGCRTTGMLIVMTDGLDEHSLNSAYKAKEAISYLTQKEVGIGFFAFGDINIAKLAKNLGVHHNNIRLLKEMDESSIRRMFELVSKSIISTSTMVKDDIEVIFDSMFDDFISI